MRALTKTVSLLERLKMPSKEQYDLVSDDGYDSRIPMHNDDAFQHGIHFPAKYVGTLDVQKPTSRVDIVSAMRRTRFEFKAKSVKKKKVIITISVEGVKVLLRRKKHKVFSEEKEDSDWDEKHLLVMHHPVYRIFYVSHDSQDLKIFSYIARDGSTNVFKCNVFKANKKSQAMRIVRTIGQAFDVCHKLSQQVVEQEAAEQKDKDAAETELVEYSPETVICDGQLDGPMLADNTSTTDYNIMDNSSQGASVPRATPKLSTSLSPQEVPISSGEPLSVQHRVKFLEQRLAHQMQGTQIALAQVNMLKDQLTVETSARLEAQTRSHSLLQQNRELLEHIETLIKYLQIMESGQLNHEATGLLTPNTSSSKSPFSVPPDHHLTSMAFIPDNSLFSNSQVSDSPDGKDFSSPDSGNSLMTSSLLYNSASPPPTLASTVTSPVQASIVTSPLSRPGYNLDINSNSSESGSQRTDLGNNNPAIVPLTTTDMQILDKIFKRVQQRKLVTAMSENRGRGEGESLFAGGSSSSLSYNDNRVSRGPVSINGLPTQSPQHGIDSGMFPMAVTNVGGAMFPVMTTNVGGTMQMAAMSNLNQQKSPEKRFSSTSVELLRQVEGQRSLTRINTRDNIQSASESHLMRNRGPDGQYRPQTISASNFASLHTK